MTRPLEKQWVLRAEGSVLRPGRTVVLAHVDEAVPRRTLIVRRRGSGSDPVRFGELVVLQTPDGVLVAAPSGIAPVVTDLAAVTAQQWEFTGGAAATTVPLDAAIALLNDISGDSLVVDAAAGSTALMWWGDQVADATGADPFAGRPPVPVPSALRAVGGVPAQVELAARLLAVDHDGLRVRLDPDVREALAVHVAGRIPAGGARTARAAKAPPEDLLVRPPEPTCPGDLRLPPLGTRVLVTGALVLDEALSQVVVDPLDGLAWAADGTLEPLGVGPADPGWPDLTLTWTALALPAPGADGRIYTLPPRPVTWFLRLPGRDGEPGSATTLSPTLVRGSASGGRRLLAGGRLGAATIGRHPRGGWRALRLPVAQPVRDGLGPPAPSVGCAVRVHLRDPQA